MVKAFSNYGQKKVKNSIKFALFRTAIEFGESVISNVLAGAIATQVDDYDGSAHRMVGF